MRKETAYAIAYVQDALTFLFLEPRARNVVRSIYLHGSAARGDLTKKSDIDLFIDCPQKYEKDVENAVNAALSNFYSSNDYNKWRYLKFEYPISFNAGELARWELASTVKAEGIILYSKDRGIAPGRREVLFVIELPKVKKEYLRFTRKLHGRKEKYYDEGGILKSLKGKKLTSTVIILPKENQQSMIDFLNKENINYSMTEISVLS